MEGVHCRSRGGGGNSLVLECGSGELPLWIAAAAAAAPSCTREEARRLRNPERQLALPHCEIAHHLRRLPLLPIHLVVQAPHRGVVDGVAEGLEGGAGAFAALVEVVAADDGRVVAGEVVAVVFEDDEMEGL